MNPTTSHRGLVLRPLLALLALGVLIAFTGADRADAKAPINGWSAEPSSTQAGGHPDVLLQMELGNRATQGFPSSCYCESPKDIIASLPPGVIGNPHAVPQCTAADFSAMQCSAESQIGIQAILLYKPPHEGGSWYLAPVYNLEPHPGQAGLLGFNQPIVPAPIYTVISARTGSDYGLDATVPGLTQTIPVFAVNQVLWGVPTDPSHDPLRYTIGHQTGSGCSADPTPYIFGNPRKELTGAVCGPLPEGAQSSATPKSFISNPTTCGVPLEASLSILAYDMEWDRASHPWASTTGCDQLSFNPSLSAQPTTKQTDAASGLDVDLTVPQAESPYAPSTSEIRETTVTLPEGFSINSNAADGKTSCSDVEARYGTEEAAQCPEYSKVGTISIGSSALPGPIYGYVYLGEPLPGNRYRIVLVADGHAVHVKLPGTVTPDPVTGRLTVSFKDLPETPFSNFNMHFFGSERGLLATPTQCGTYAVKSTYTPWATELPAQSSTQFFNLDSGPEGKPCPPAQRPFAPTMQAGVKDNTGGAHAPFAISLHREDGDQNLTGITVKTPPGFAATLKGVPYCSESAIAALSAPGSTGLAEQAAPSCRSASQVGTAIASVGAGTRPLYTPGKVYLAGPYKGAPLSLEVVLPAVSGPYDLGNVAVRAAVYVDPVSAQITTVSDPLPQIIEGIPLRIRSVLINLDRPTFTLNPTNCDPFAVAATLTGNQGAQSSSSFAFQSSNCADLDYAPKLAVTLSGGTKRRGHPAIHAVLTTAPGEANSKRVSVALPRGELLDVAHLGGICTRVQFAARACPAYSIYGEAEAISPLLDAPLKGKVYLRASDHKLPDLVADLKGQIEIELAGRIDTVNGGSLRTTFENLPDTGVSKFVLRMAGGNKGLLINQKSLCAAPGRAIVKMAGQNGLTTSSKAKLQTDCGKTRRGKRGGKR